MSMRLFDTHTHLGDARFDPDRTEVLRRARAAGVERIVEVAFDVTSSRAVCALADRYRNEQSPDAPAIWCAIGVHPHDADTVDAQAMAQLRALLAAPPADRIVAIGEIGLDYYYDHAPRERQREAFLQQLLWARKASLPVVIHERKATADCLAVLREAGYGAAPSSTAAERVAATHAPGVFHCFSGSVETALIVADMGFYLGFDGPLTFKNARKAPDVVRAIPRDRVLIETDCPYLAPVPYRGKRNEPAYIREVARALADLWGCDLATAAEQTRQNACRLFGLAP